MKPFIPEYIVQDVCKSPSVSEWIEGRLSWPERVEESDFHELIRLALHEGAAKIVEVNTR